jgi:hypothetical protein
MKMFVLALQFLLHFAILGALADLALQLHAGQSKVALIHAGIACLCILGLAGAFYFAKKLLGDKA